MKRRGFMGLAAALGFAKPEELVTERVRSRAIPYAVAGNVAVNDMPVVSGFVEDGDRAWNKAALKAWQHYTRGVQARRGRKEYAGGLLGGHHPHTVMNRSWAPWFRAQVSARKFLQEQEEERNWMERAANMWWKEDDPGRPYF